MNRRAFFLGMAGLAGCARDSRPRLNVYNWSAYVAPETIPGFEAEFGVRSATPPTRATRRCWPRC